MQNYTANPETSNDAIERWKKSCRTPEQYKTIQNFLAVRPGLPVMPQTFKKFVTMHAQKALLNLSAAGKQVKELLDLIVIFGEGTNETLAEALRIEPVNCTSDTPRELPAPTMLEILGSDIIPDLFDYLLTLPAATTAQQFVDGCTSPTYLILAAEELEWNWETVGRMVQYTENLSNEEGMDYLRSTMMYSKMIVDGLNKRVQQ